MSTSFDLGFLDGLDEDFERGASVGKADILTDGDYEFEVNEAKWKVLDRKNMAIIELELEVLTPGPHAGAKIQHAIFIKDADSVVRVKKDLVTLGFDCDLWTKANGRPFSQEIQKVHKALKKMRFAGKKVTKKEGPATYHNLYISKRIHTDGKPQRIGPAELDAHDPDDPFAAAG